MANISAFVAYRHTGENPEELRPMLEAVCDALRKRGIDTYCTFFSEEQFQNRSLLAREIMDHAFDEIDRRDILFVIQSSPNKSEGMIMEVGYCRALQRMGVKKLIVVAVNAALANAPTYLPEMADRIIAWRDPVYDIRSHIEELDFEALLA